MQGDLFEMVAFHNSVTVRYLCFATVTMNKEPSSEIKYLRQMWRLNETWFARMFVEELMIAFLFDASLVCQMLPQWTKKSPHSITMRYCH